MHGPEPDPPDSFEFPCSFAQQRLWLDDRLAPGGTYYNIHASIRLAVPMDPAPLRRALDRLTARHESLRTTFAERDGVPVQCVAGAGAVDFACEDLAPLARDERERQVAALAAAEAGRPFDLARGPLLRVRLLRTGALECVLMLTIHHIVADAWSMAVLLRELTALYANPDAALPPLEIQYADYAVWQRQGGDDAGLAADLAYWRDRLAGLAPLELPTDRRRPRAASHRGRTLHFAFEPGLSGAVLAFARERAVTPYVVLVAALAVVFQRNAGQDEIVLGVPVAGRGRPELEHLIGFFVNTLVLRLDLGGEPDFAALVAHVQQALHGALAHQAVPFERLVEALNCPRDLARNPLFQVSVQYLAAPGMAAPAGGGATVMDVQRGGANFDLAIDFWHDGARLAGRVDYAVDLFDEGTVARWQTQLQRVLAQGVGDGALPIESIDPLTAAERALLTGPWAGAPLAYPHAGIAELVAAAAARQPGAAALAGAFGSWTYAALDERAGRIAALLAQHGVGTGGNVGIGLARGPDQVAGALAALRLGAAYVALDPRWPGPRLCHCADQARVRVVLCAPADVDRFAACGVPVADPAAAAALPVLPVQRCDPAAPAYIAFTSGSTGTPKGVVVPQRAVARLVCGNPQVPLRGDDTMLLHAPLAFDASTLEIWGALCNGACLSVPPAGPLGLDELADWLVRERVTVAWLTAGLFHQMAVSHPRALARLDRLYAGGDALSAEAVGAVLSQPGHCIVLNGYGPTENTTFTCVHAMASAADVDTPVPIGRPIAGGYVRVLDGRGRLAPVGAVGELYAGGDGLALGYLGGTAAGVHAFLPDPLGAPGARLYRTGDLVRWRADGVLEFLGRADRQVKVRGYRIEPAEVESALRTLPGVRDAHVLARADGSGDKTLVAWVAGHPGAPPAELLRRLGAMLPAWMVPATLHVCEQLRLTPNGKVDEAALTAACVEAPAAEAPDGELEALVAQVWSDVLDRPVRDVHAGFFTDLGGHSLLATQVVSRLNAALGIALPLAAIFEEPDLRGFARRVEDLLMADVLGDPS